MKVQISPKARALASQRRLQRTPFKNRAEAGQMLAERLQGYAGREDCLILGVPRGGIAVAYELSRALQLPLDVLLSEPLTVPTHKGQVIGALAAEGGASLDYALIRAAAITPDEVATALDAARAGLKRRKRIYRPRCRPLDLRGKTVLLVDDGSGTAAALLAAVHILRRMQAAKIVAALPVCADGVCRHLEQAVDLLIALKRPATFFSLETTYTDFKTLADEDILPLLAERRAARTPRRPRPAPVPGQPASPSPAAAQASTGLSGCEP